ncbi:hypothetical protein IPZ58_29790 [Streptomyces roseoverticillatus]|uniref:hypothetical protein n=1 Tax=Streptomyces roseoverticillatus TaxID=66429 RepID=UPI001F16478C|nr:hypothetical protein [Streptomyces roseoverticillatus]MCF3105749.1 hypothetical protein [Streptomyces roseoverticillatus]
MNRQANRYAPAALAILLACAGLTGCSSDGPTGSTASSAASAARSGASAVASAASSAAASAVGSAVASAEAAAEAALGKIKGGLDAKADVTLGSVATGSDGRMEVPVNAVNHDSKARRYTLLIKFKDQSGNLVDVVTVDIPEVAAGGTAHATARSNRNLTGTVTAEVSKAVRY